LELEEKHVFGQSMINNEGWIFWFGLSQEQETSQNLTW